MTLFDLIRQYSIEIKNGRDPASILSTATSELGELAQEVNAGFSKTSYKTPGKDGIVGEAVDTIIAIVDLVCQCYPDITEEKLLGIAQKKLDKWRDLDARHRDEKAASRKARVAYEFPDEVTIEVDYLSNGEPAYAIRAAEGRLCCNKDGYWEDERSPQDQDEDFIDRARWSNANEAIGFRVQTKDRGWSQSQIQKDYAAGLEAARQHRMVRREK